MIAVTNKVMTNHGPLALSKIIEEYTDADTSEMCNRIFVANRRREQYGFVAQPNGYWIEPTKEIKLMNQKGKWERLRDLYFHGTMDDGLRKINILNSHDKEANRKNISDIVASENYHLWRIDGAPVKFKELGFKALIQIGDKSIEETAAMVYGFALHLTRVNCVSIRLENGGWGVVFENGVLGHVGFWARPDGTVRTVEGGGIA